MISSNFNLTNIEKFRKDCKMLIIAQSYNRDTILIHPTHQKFGCFPFHKESNKINNLQSSQ